MLRFLLFALLTARITANNSTVNDSVLVLTAKNFDKVLQENEFVLVKFYAPWCGHSNRAAPEFSSAAEQLRGEGSAIKLAKVDCTVELKLAERFKIKEYPSFKFFKNETTIDYTGARATLDFVNWLKKKTGPPARHLKDKEAAAAIKNDADVVIIGFFKDPESEDAKTFLKVADKYEELLFGITSDADVFAEHKKKKDGVALFKKFDQSKNDFFGQLTEDALSSFINENQLPLVIELTQEVVNKIFTSSVRKHVVLFLRKEGNEEILKEFEEVAKDFKGSFLFILINVDLEDNKRILKLFNLKEDGPPALRVVALVDKMKRFLPNSEGVDKVSIRKLIQDYFDNKLERHLISEEIPKGWESQPVKTLVGKTYDQVVHDKDNAVFVIFVAPWCGQCSHFVTILEDVAKASADDIVIAQIDSTANELEDVNILTFPTFKYYPKGSDKKVIDYEGKQTLEAFDLFLSTEGKEIIPADEEKQPEDEGDEEAEGEAQAEEEKEAAVEGEKEEKKEPVVEEEDKKEEKKETGSAKEGVKQKVEL